VPTRARRAFAGAVPTIVATWALGGLILSLGGFGCAFLGALRSVSQLAEPHERAALLSAVYLVSYIAFSVPAMIEGLITTHIGLLNTSFGYGGFVALVAAGALIFERLTGREHRDAA
jgi:Ca2+/H+ antiporter